MRNRIKSFMEIKGKHHRLQKGVIQGEKNGVNGVEQKRLSGTEKNQIENKEYNL